MILSRYNLTPNEKKLYTIEYSDWLNTLETITIAQFDVDDVTIPPLVIDGVAIDVGGTLVGFYASGGVDLIDYNVRVIITTSLLQRKEDEIVFSVRDE